MKGVERVREEVVDGVAVEVDGVLEEVADGIPDEVVEVSLEGDEVEAWQRTRGRRG